MKRTGKMLSLFLLMAVTAVTIHQSAQAGGAVVMDMQAASKAKMPILEKVKSGSANLGQPLRKAGLNVAADPTGRIVAVWPQRHPPPEVPELLQDERSTIRAVAIVEKMTMEQFTARKKGYLYAEQMSPSVLAITTAEAKRHGVIDADGKPRRSGERLALEISPGWTLHVAAMDKHGRTVCVRLTVYHGMLPDPDIIAATPLKGSPLWYSWPGFGAKWGAEKVSVSEGTYTITDLLSRLSRDAALSVSAMDKAGSTKLKVSAQDVAARDLLWAVMLASGTQLQITPQESAPKLELAQPQSLPIGYPDYNSLTPIRTLGYYSPDSSANGKNLIDWYNKATSQKAYWRGWRVSDLPMLYQNQIKQEWQRQVQFHQIKDVTEFYPDTTYALWTPGVRVGFCMVRPDGGGGGHEASLAGF